MITKPPSKQLFNELKKAKATSKAINKCKSYSYFTNKPDSSRTEMRKNPNNSTTNQQNCETIQNFQTTYSSSSHHTYYQSSNYFEQLNNNNNNNRITTIIAMK